MKNNTGRELSYKILLVNTANINNFQLFEYKFKFKKLFNQHFLFDVYEDLHKFLLSKNLIRKNKFNKDGILILKGFLTKYQIACSGRSNIIYYSSVLKRNIDTTLGGKTGAILAGFNYDGIFFFSPDSIDNMPENIKEKNKGNTLKGNKKSMTRSFVFFKDKFSIIDFELDFLKIKTDYSVLKFNSNMFYDNGRNGNYFIQFNDNLMYGVKNEKGRFLGKFGLGNSFFYNNISKIIFIDDYSESFEKEFEREIENNFLIKIYKIDSVKAKEFNTKKDKRITLKLKNYLIKTVYYNKLKEQKPLKQNKEFENEFKNNEEELNHNKFNNFELSKSAKIYGIKTNYKDIEIYVKNLLNKNIYCPAYCIRYKITTCKISSKKNSNHFKDKNKDKINLYTNIVSKISNMIYIDIDFIREFVKSINFDIVNIDIEDIKNDQNIIHMLIYKISTLGRKEVKVILNKIKHKKNIKIPAKVMEVLDNKDLSFNKIRKKIFLLSYKNNENILNNLGLCVFTLFSINMKKMKKLIQK